VYLEHSPRRTRGPVECWSGEFCLVGWISPLCPRKSRNDLQSNQGRCLELLRTRLATHQSRRQRVDSRINASGPGGTLVGFGSSSIQMDSTIGRSFVQSQFECQLVPIKEPTTRFTSVRTKDLSVVQFAESWICQQAHFLSDASEPKSHGGRR